MNETELDRLAGTRMQLEMQVNTLESANLNAETMQAMKKASEALKVIHGNMYVASAYCGCGDWLTDCNRRSCLPLPLWHYPITAGSRNNFAMTRRSLCKWCT